jgi:hypothetical protein
MAQPGWRAPSPSPEGQGRPSAGTLGRLFSSARWRCRWLVAEGAVRRRRLKRHSRPARAAVRSYLTRRASGRLCHRLPPPRDAPVRLVAGVSASRTRDARCGREAVVRRRRPAALLLLAQSSTRQARPARFFVLVQAGVSGTRAETLACRPLRAFGARRPKRPQSRSVLGDGHAFPFAKRLPRNTASPAAPLRRVCRVASLRRRPAGRLPGRNCGRGASSVHATPKNRLNERVPPSVRNLRALKPA